MFGLFETRVGLDVFLLRGSSETRESPLNSSSVLIEADRETDRSGTCTNEFAENAQILSSGQNSPSQKSTSSFKSARCPRASLAVG